MGTSRFPNRIAALAFVVLVLAGVAALVGTGENEGALSSATQALSEKSRQSSGYDAQSGAQPASGPSQKQSAAAPAPTPPTASAAMTSSFAEDANLIDDAMGFDPSPMSDNPDEGEVVVIIEDAAPAETSAPIVAEEP